MAKFGEMPKPKLVFWPIAAAWRGGRVHILAMYLPKKRFCRSRTLKLFTCQLRRLVKHMFLSVFALAFIL